MSQHTLSFQPAQPWALLPRRNRVDVRPLRQEAELYARDFRWIRRNRVPELCVPWRLGQELGWAVESPVSVQMHPLDDLELACAEDEIGTLGRATPFTELWPRGDGMIALPKSSWLRMYDFRNGDGFQSMFVPNGASTVEWHLGWSVVVPPGYFLLVMPWGTDNGLDIPLGVLDSKAVRRVCEKGSFAIAVRPRRAVTVARGQPVARLLLLHRDSLTPGSPEETRDEAGDAT